MRTCGVAIALVASLLAGTASAQAVAPAAKTSTLGWSRLPGAELCITARELAQAVERRLGRSIFVAPAEAELGIEGHVAVAAPPASYRAVLHLVDGDGALLGTRELVGAEASCSDLAASVELAVALMIDPDARGSSPAPTSPVMSAGPTLAPTTPSAPRDDAGTNELPGDEAPPSATFQVTAGPMVSAGYIPGVSAGAQVRARLDPDGLPAVTVGGVLVPPATTGNATFMLGYGTVALCPWTGSVVVGVLAPCVGVGSGAIHVAGPNVASPVVHPVIEVTLSRRLAGPLIASIDLGVGAPLVRPTFHFSHVFQTAPVMAAGGVGIGLEAP